MTEPTNLDEHRPHITKLMRCFSCMHEWRAVFPETTESVQCPKCAAMVTLGDYGTEIIGPFRGDYYRLSSYGFEVPNVRLYRRDDTDTDWTFLFDERYELDVNTEEVLRWAGMFAEGMAVAAGYTKHGEGSVKANLYARRISSTDDFDGHS